MNTTSNSQKNTIFRTNPKLVFYPFLKDIQAIRKGLFFEIHNFANLQNEKLPIIYANIRV